MFEEMRLTQTSWGIAGWKDVDVSVPVTFPGCAKHFRLPSPFILGGYWSWDMVGPGTKSNVLVPIGPTSVDWVDWTVGRYEKHDTYSVVYKFGGDMIGMPSFLDAMLEVYDRLTDKTKFKFVQIDLTYVTPDFGMYVLKKVRLALPDVVIIVGPALTQQHYHNFYRAGADAVVLSRPSSTARVQFGLDNRPRKLLQTCKEKSVVIADFSAESSAEVIKCLALGAQMVTIGPSLGDIVIEELADAVKKACIYTGFTRLQDFYPLTIG